MLVLKGHVLARLADCVVLPVLCPCFAIDCCLLGSGAYLCVKGYGSTATTYALRADYTRCPSDFTDDGQELMCSSLVSAPESGKRYTGCSADGVCSCKPPYQKPLPEVYEGKSHGAIALRAECRRSVMVNDIVIPCHTVSSVCHVNHMWSITCGQGRPCALPLAILISPSCKLKNVKFQDRVEPYKCCQQKPAVLHIGLKLCIVLNKHNPCCYGQAGSKRPVLMGSLLLECAVEVTPCKFLNATEISENE